MTQALTEGFQDLSSVADGVCVISASSPEQFSQEGHEWGGGHGVFTHFLLRGLKGEADSDKDGAVNLGEITLYLSQKVRRETANAQTPMVHGSFDLALTIAR